MPKHENKKYNISIYNQGNAINIDIEGKDLQIKDEWHTMQEIYDHRCKLYIKYLSLISSVKSLLTLDNQEVRDLYIWRLLSKDNDCNFDGWFLLGIGLDPGKQITYHVPQKFLIDTDFALYLDKQNDQSLIYEGYDGHKSLDVLNRLDNLEQMLEQLITKFTKTRLAI